MHGWRSRRRWFTRRLPLRRQQYTLCPLRCRHAQRQDRHFDRRRPRPRGSAGPRRRRWRQLGGLVGEAADVGRHRRRPLRGGAGGGPSVSLITAINDDPQGSRRRPRRRHQERQHPPAPTTRFAAVAAAFATLNDPLIYTPGDNEWTDCHRANNGAFNPLERLAAIRSLFFAEPGDTLGRHPKHVDAQPGYPENVRWIESRVAFATLHVIGSNNGLSPWTGLGFSAPTAEQAAEVGDRIDATLEWIDADLRRRRRSRPPKASCSTCRPTRGHRHPAAHNRRLSTESLSAPPRSTGPLLLHPGRHPHLQGGRPARPAQLHPHRRARRNPAVRVPAPHDRPPRRRALQLGTSPDPVTPDRPYRQALSRSAMTSASPTSRTASTSGATVSTTAARAVNLA